MRKLLGHLLAAGGFACSCYVTRRLLQNEDIRSEPTRRYLAASLPLWIVPGLLDWACHRDTRIEETSGATESAQHVAMLGEAGSVLLAGFFLEINAGALAIMLAGNTVHVLTAFSDLLYTEDRRDIPAFEQQTHCIQEGVPMAALAVAAATHWDQVERVLSGTADWTLRFHPSMRRGDVIALTAVFTAFGLLPYLEELGRCLVGGRKGRRIAESQSASQGLLTFRPRSEV